MRHGATLGLPLANAKPVGTSLYPAVASTFGLVAVYLLAVVKVRVEGTGIFHESWVNQFARQRTNNYQTVAVTIADGAGNTKLAEISERCEQLRLIARQIMMARQTLRDMVMRIRTVARIVEEATDASTGQAIGIEQINKAIAQIEKLT